MRSTIPPLLLIILSVFQPVAPQSAGVSPGHYGRYAISGDLSEGAVRSEFTVLTVAQAGTNVTVSNTDTFSDGGTNTTTYWFGLVDGASNAPPGLHFLIFPGKQVGEPAYQSATLTIERRENRTYANAVREVNFANFTEPSRSTGYYWDVGTGIFAEIVVMYVDPGTGDLKRGLLVTMVDTNIWSPDSPSNPDTAASPIIFYLAATMLGAGLLFGFLIYSSKRSKRRRIRSNLHKGPFPSQHLSETITCLWCLDERGNNTYTLM